MLENPAYDIFADDSRVTVTVDRSQVEVDELIQFMDFLRVQSFLRRNTLTEDEILALADEVKHKVWVRVKRRLIRAGMGNFLPDQEREGIEV